MTYEVFLSKLALISEADPQFAAHMERYIDECKRLKSTIQRGHWPPIYCDDDNGISDITIDGDIRLDF